jgi:hypothetical protein
MSAGTLDKEAVLDAIEEVLIERERIETPAEARLALLLHAERPWLGPKDRCDCGERETCDECSTEEEALAYCRKLAESDITPPASPAPQVAPDEEDEGSD